MPFRQQAGTAEACSRLTLDQVRTDLAIDGLFFQRLKRTVDLLSTSP